MVDTGLWATTSSPRRTSSPDPSLTMTSPWVGTTSGSTGRVEVGGGGIAAARPQEEGCMAVITRGFGGRRRDDTDLPPGQYRTDDFSLVLLGRRHRLAPVAFGASASSFEPDVREPEVHTATGSTARCSGRLARRCTRRADRRPPCAKLERAALCGTRRASGRASGRSDRGSREGRGRSGPERDMQVAGSSTTRTP